MCFAGFDDTTMLDFVSRGLDCRKLEEKRRGDFEPGHRVAVFAEQPATRRRAARTTERSSDERETNGEVGGDSQSLPAVRIREGSPESPSREKKKQPSPPPGLEPGTARGDSLPGLEPATRGVEYLAIVSQLDVIDAMVRTRDALGAFVRLKSMADLGFTHSSGVVCVTETLPTAAAFAVANNCEVSATPVLDASRRFLLGSVSVSDARAFRSAEDLRWLNEPVGSFLKRKVWPSRPSMMPTPTPSAANDDAEKKNRKG